VADTDSDLDPEEVDFDPDTCEADEVDLVADTEADLDPDEVDLDPDT